MNTPLRSEPLANGRLSRRCFLRLAATGLAGAALAACAPAAAPAPAAPAAATAAPAQAAATEAPKPTSAPAAASKATITVYECCWDETHTTAGKALYDDFGKQNPNIVTNVFWPAAGEDWTAKLLAQVAANDPIDIIWWCSSHHKFAEDGRLLDLKDIVNGDTAFKLDDYQAVGVDFCYDKPGRQGALWGVPTNYATILLWYNMKLFDDAGVAYPNAKWTYDDLLQAALKLTKSSGGKTSQWGLYTGGNDVWTWEPIVKAFGGGLVDIEAAQPCQATQAESLTALNWLADLQFKHKVTPTTADMAGLGAQAMLISNQLAMGLWPEWGQFEFLKAHTDNKLTYGVTLMPTGPKGRVTNYWPGITSIMKRTTAAAAAWEVAKFICGEKYQTRMTVELPESPAALKKVAEYRFTTYDKYPDDRSALLESPKYGALYEAIRRYGKEMDDIIRPGFDPVWEGKSKPEQVTSDICSKVNAKAAELKGAKS